MKLARLSDIQQEPFQILRFNDMFLRSLIYSFYLAVAHGQAWDEPASVNAQGKQHNGRGYTESIGCVAREIETLYVERDS